jgi:hypothetical protein
MVDPVKKIGQIGCAEQPGAEQIVCFGVPDWDAD